MNRDILIGFALLTLRILVIAALIFGAIWLVISFVEAVA